jgi:hypothetical protein
MEPDRLLLIFERSPEESRLTGVSEAIRAFEENDIDVKAVAQNPVADGLIVSALRFWFPYLWSAGITGVVPGAGAPAEAREFVVKLAPILGPVFGTVLGGWLQTQAGRKIRVRFNDIEIEAQTPEQAETLLARLLAGWQGQGSHNPARAQVSGEEP